MTEQAQSGAVDLEATTVADLARMVGQSIAETLEETVRHIVREELARQRQADPRESA